MIAIRLGNSSSKGAGWLPSKWRHSWKFVPKFLLSPPHWCSFPDLQHHQITSSDFYGHDTAGRSCSLSVQCASVRSRVVSILCCLISARTVLGSDPCLRLTRLVAGSRCVCVRYSRRTTSWLMTWSSERNRVVSRRISLLQAVAAAGWLAYV